MLDQVIAGADTNYANLRSPGRIQSFGVLLALHPRTLRVLSASENVQAELGVAHADILGLSLLDLIGPGDVAAEIRACAEDEHPTFQNPVPVEIRGRRFDIVLHTHDSLIFAEFEPLAPGAPSRADMDRLSEGAIMGMIVPDTMDELITAGAQTIRAATDFDRVLVYKFDEAYRGQVVGEARREGVDSFLGLFFPESDIAQPARHLYEQTFCRYIPRLDGPNVRVSPADSPLSGRPLDMSLCILRGVAPCHIEYLTNMGVVASMSFSIVFNGRLWGLFACHHYAPARLSYVQRLVCEQVAMMFVAKLDDLINPEAEAADMKRRLAAVVGTSPICDPAPLRQSWSTADEAALLALVDAESAAIYQNGEVGQIGPCPDFAELHAYITQEPAAFGRLMRMYDDRGLFYSNCISSVLPFGDKMREKGSGVLVVPLAAAGNCFIIWFRPELVVQATWGGNPGDRGSDDAHLRFSPRKSFAAWKEDIRDRAKPWTAAEIGNAVALRDHLLSGS